MYQMAAKDLQSNLPYERHYNLWFKDFRDSGLGQVRRLLPCQLPLLVCS